jgi:hypothetical protein
MNNAGIIEGYFGTPWSMDNRMSYASFMNECGLRFFIYAPKNDPNLRKKWDEPWADDYINGLSNLADTFHRHGIEFGIGFTPAGDASDISAKPQILTERCRNIVGCLPLDYFVLLFDDLVNNDRDRLAYHQLKITDLVLDATDSVKRHIVCPSYYSFDPVLEKVFGAMPRNYWNEYASSLDPRVDIFWTGEKVCSSGYSSDHLVRVADIFKRRPFLWDNYPVNDGKKMADYLYLEPYRDRGSFLDELTSGHAVNPMREPAACKIVLATLAFAYKDSPLDASSHEYWRIAEKVLGKDVCELLKVHWEVFVHCGRSSIEPGERGRLAEKYRSCGTAQGREIADYLDGRYEFDPACLTG